MLSPAKLLSTMLVVRYKTANFRPWVMHTLATPTQEVGMTATLQRVFLKDWRIFAPSLKLVAVIVQKLCTIICSFLEHVKWPFLKFAHVMYHACTSMNYR